MEVNNMHINEKLEKQKIAELFEQRKNVDQNDPEAVNKMLNELISELVMNTKFIAPVTVEGDGDEKNVTFKLIQSPQKEKYFPIFTSSEDLAVWEDVKDMQTMLFRFDNYAQILAQNNGVSGIVVNPFTNNFPVNKQLVAQWYTQKQMLVNGHAHHAITDDSKYELYAPSPYPFQLSDKLCEAAKELPEINRLWLRGITLDGREGYLVVVDFDGDMNMTFPALGGAAKEYFTLPVHFVPYVAGFGENAVKDVLPIYVK
ncbi:MAG: enhanced serine sensitivity protein SseB [Oscillospiraceae bacterium]|nr:enhanced serine sensitivity protein SseB [Oscillospiraceae bacterium]